MTTRRVLAAVFVLTMMGASEAMYASSVTAVGMPVRAMFGHEKIVHFGVTNGTNAPLKLKCGEEVVSVDPGKTAAVRLPAGSKVTFIEANGSHKAGELLAEATGHMNGTTISVH